jgi:hypothetical protein
MIRKSTLAPQIRRWLGHAIAIGGSSLCSRPVPRRHRAKRFLFRIEIENGRRHVPLKQYSGSRQYTLENLRFGKHAAVACA